MSYLLGGGWWTLWYALLWLAVTPFVAMTAALTRATPNEPMLAMENAFAVGSVGLFVLMGATANLGVLLDRRRIDDGRLAVRAERRRRGGSGAGRRLRAHLWRQLLRRHAATAHAQSMGRTVALPHVRVIPGVLLRARHVALSASLSTA